MEQGRCLEELLLQAIGSCLPRLRSDPSSSFVTAPLVTAGLMLEGFPQLLPSYCLRLSPATTTRSE